MEFGIKNIVFFLVLSAAVIFLTKNLLRIFSYLKVAKPDNRFDNPGARLRHTLAVAMAQTKILRDKTAGPLHVAIFWGFIVLLFSASEAVFQGLFGSFSWNFLGPVCSVITISTDIFCVAIIVAILASLYRRFIAKVPRLQGDENEKKDALAVLLSILTIVIALLLTNAAGTKVHTGHEYVVFPVGSAIASLMSPESAKVMYEIFWWIHIVAILSFANYLPYSKHFHVYTSIPNVYFSSLTPVNKLEPIDFEEEGVEKFGVTDIEDLKWPALLDSMTCTHCGRCTSVCPANTTGKALDPRNIMVQIRERTFQKAPILVAMEKLKAAGTDEPALTPEQQEIMDKKFVGDYENIEAIWQCTSCGACMQECPVMNEHVPAIIGMRRSLVMMESNFPAELQSTFANLENNGTPWAFSPSERADWAEGLDIKQAADGEPFDILFWVGCAGSFDDRAKKISVAFSKLMKAAGINFAILGMEEQCNGDVARRAGNEYLADMLIKANIETLQRYDVKKIVTICPHCFNTFKNEYPAFGAQFEVIHHTEFLKDLLNRGLLKISDKGRDMMKVACHDSCYLGRYNEIYDAPRSILKRVGGKIEEPGRSRDKGFCCGAGGGQMFMEETEGKRVNIERTEELLATGADTIAVNCPFCMTMITDGVKAKDAEDVKVKDISEILLEHIDSESATA